METLEGFGPGQILAGKYRIDHLLGRGGMGMVVAATHLGLNRQVALKFMLPRELKNSQAVKRFLREARAVALLTSPHVVRVFDVGRLEGGGPYIEMERLNGLDLGRLAQRVGPLPATVIAEYIAQAALALEEAHGHGIVHRDLKPAHLFLTKTSDGSPLVKVLDFGICRADTTTAAITDPSTWIGTPIYMAPEQITASNDVDCRADIWALGVVLYELCTGRHPFQATDIQELFDQIVAKPVPPAEIPPVLFAIIRRCLAKKPGQRYASMAELRLALLTVARAGATPVKARPSRPAASASAALAHAATQHDISASAGHRSWRVRTTLITLAALGAILLGG